MDDLFAPAVREQIRLRAAIDGPTGSGKTWTALQWARILAGPDGQIGFVDTESESAKRYAPAPGDATERVNWWDPPYTFGWRGFDPPYDPRKLAQIIDTAGKALGQNGVLVIDSLTHFWNAEGGTLDIVDDAGQGNSFAGWKEGTPAQRYLLGAMLRCRCHLIICMRSKMEYVLETVQNRRGQNVQMPKRVGMAPEQRAGIEYEFDVVASMSLPDHTLTITKSRIDAVSDRVAHKGRSHEVAQALVEWLSTGARKITDAEAEQVMDLFDRVPAEDRRQIKNDFVALFGTPYDLLADQLDAALAWVGERAVKTEPTPAVTEPEPMPETPAEPKPEVPDPAPRSRRKADDIPSPADLDDDALAGAAALADQGGAS
jgi:hypothetical protein